MKLVLGFSSQLVVIPKYSTTHLFPKHFFFIPWKPYDFLMFSGVDSLFSNIQTECRKIQSIYLYSVRMGENTDQKNSEYGHFSHSVYYTEILDFRSDAIKKTKSKNGIRAAELVAIIDLPDSAEFRFLLESWF